MVGNRLPTGNGWQDLFISFVGCSHIRRLLCGWRHRLVEEMHYFWRLHRRLWQAYCLRSAAGAVLLPFKMTEVWSEGSDLSLSSDKNDWSSASWKMLSIESKLDLSSEELSKSIVLAMFNGVAFRDGAWGLEECVDRSWWSYAHYVSSPVGLFVKDVGRWLV